jgi:hypothetical protein
LIWGKVIVYAAKAAIGRFGLPAGCLFLPYPHSPKSKRHFKPPPAIRKNPNGMLNLRKPFGKMEMPF